MDHNSWWRSVMRLWMVALIAVAAVSLGTWAVYAQPAAPAQPGAAQAQQAVYRCPMHSDVEATWPATCPKCGMTLQKVSAPSGMMGMGSMQQGAHQMPMQDMMARHQMLMTAQLGKDDPAAMLSIRDRLKLTDGQVTKLESLAHETGQKAQALLTDEQREALATVPDEPKSMMAMCNQMMSMMSGGMGAMHGMGGQTAGLAH
jgi:hypothetical protein